MPAGPVLLTTTEFTLRSAIPAEQVAVLINTRTGFLEKSISGWSRWIEARLRKRYNVPFTGDTPEIVIVWLVALVTRDAYAALGTNLLNDEDRRMVNEAAERALAEVKEAADEEDGLFDLPLRDDQSPSALEEEAPLGSAQASPYSWTDDQAQALEDDKP